MKTLSRILVALFVIVLAGGIYFIILVNNFNGGVEGFWNTIENKKNVYNFKNDVNQYIKENLGVNNLRISDDLKYLEQDEGKFKIIYTFFGTEITSCKLKFTYNKSDSTSKSFDIVKEQLNSQEVPMEDIYVEDEYIYVKISDKNIKSAINEYIGVDYSKIQDVLMYIIQRSKEI